jgi:WD40 repeat protein
METAQLGTAQLGTARLLKSFTMPVDAAVFAGTPSVTALRLLPSANVLLAAAMDRRVVACELSAEPPAATGDAKTPAAIAGKHLSWSHENWIHTLDVHPDGQRVATGGADRAIKLWKWGQEEPLAAIKGHDEWVRTLAFSPDGSLLASAGDDRLVKLWDVETAQPVATLDPKTDYLDVLAWSPDGKTLHAGGSDGKIHSWAIEQKALLRATDIDNRRAIEDEPLNGGFSYPGGIRGMASSGDGKLLAAVGLTSLVVLDAQGKEVLNQGGRGFGVAFHPTNRWLAFSQEKDLAFWDFEQKKEVHRIQANQLGLFDMFFFDGGKRLAAGGCNGLVGIWEFEG